jgi:hypothetical protein
VQLDTSEMTIEEATARAIAIVTAAQG